MSNFVQDLQDSLTAAEELRKNVKSDDWERRHREQRQEAQLVAEVYRILRGKGYSSGELFMECLYKPISIDGVTKKLKPDLIYENGEADEVVEFRVFWEGDLFKNSSSINGTAQGTVQKYYEKLMLYQRLPRIASTSLVFAYLGPEKLAENYSFSPKQFRTSVLESIKEPKSATRKKVPIEVIVK